jgi:hypothetical protein
MHVSLSWANDLIPIDPITRSLRDAQFLPDLSITDNQSALRGQVCGSDMHEFGSPG